jgi:hypothetical protein
MTKTSFGEWWQAAILLNAARSASFNQKSLFTDH